MCCICFECTFVDDLWRDENGQLWDMCKTCGELEGVSA